MRFAILLAVSFALVACDEEETEAETLVRGLKTHLVSKSEDSSERRFPAVLEASELTPISFEVGGKLGHMGLAVGQRLSAGDEIARLDQTSLELQVETAEAAVDQAEAAARNAQSTYERQQQLLERGSTTQVAVDDALTQVETTSASLVQAQRSFDSAVENLGKAVLTAPFDAIVSSVEVQSFASVSVGAPIATIYPENSFEVAFSVSFDTVNQLVVGKEALVRLADRPDIELAAVVTEIGSRADAVSSFPIVLELRDQHPLLKAGMAVEASLRFPLPAAEGFTIPLTAAILDGASGQPGNGNVPIYVFDPASSTVKRREVQVGGISENSIIVIDGLSEGDRIASAGVSFLQDGQQVKLLESED